MDFLRAFLEALDRGRTEPGRAPAVPEPPPVQPLPPLGAVVEALSARVASLEASMTSMVRNVTEEVERGIRASEAQRGSVRRLIKELEGRYELADPDPEFSGAHAPGGESAGVLPLRGVVEAETPPSDEAIRAAARRAVAFNR